MSVEISRYSSFLFKIPLLTFLVVSFLSKIVFNNSPIESLPWIAFFEILLNCNFISLCCRGGACSRPERKGLRVIDYFLQPISDEQRPSSWDTYIRVVVNQSIGIISETVSRRLTAKWTIVLVDGQQWRKALGLDILALVGIEDAGIKPLPRALRTFIDLKGNELLGTMEIFYYNTERFLRM